MKTNKVTILTVATLATLALANNAKADAQDSPVSSQEAPTALVTNPEGNNTTEVKQLTEITKEGTEITVKNPEVVVDQSNGTGKYQPFSVEYKNIHFDDNMAINEGDKVKFTLPEEVKFQTSFDFDVYNPDKQVVGKATTDAENNTVTTVFNNYFASHPLNKQMSLKLDATWTDKVQSGKPVTANFNGTLVTTQIGKEQVIGKDELITKWGSQDKEDHTVINWTARVNYARRLLNHVTIIDEMSDNQKLVDNYFEIKNIESLDPWIDKGSAMDLVKSISKKDHGFEITMDRLDHMIYLYYKTKLTNSVAESTNPTNKIELKAEDAGSVAYQKIQLVRGRGDAQGENKPVWEIPNDAPKYEKPSININDIPLMPPAPVLDKPELHIPVEPKKPNTPPTTPEVPNTPVTPKEEHKKPLESPKVEPKKEEVKVENKGEVSHETPMKPVTTYKAPMLPQTGSEAGVALSVLGLTVLSLTVAFKKKEN